MHSPDLQCCLFGSYASECGEWSVVHFYIWCTLRSFIIAHVRILSFSYVVEPWIRWYWIFHHFASVQFAFSIVLVHYSQISIRVWSDCSIWDSTLYRVSSRVIWWPAIGFISYTLCNYSARYHTSYEFYLWQLLSSKGNQAFYLHHFKCCIKHKTYKSFEAENWFSCNFNCLQFCSFFSWILIEINFWNMFESLDRKSSNANLNLHQ